jgi:hypothetical protein
MRWWRRFKCYLKSYIYKNFRGIRPVELLATFFDKSFQTFAKPASAGFLFGALGQAVGARGKTVARVQRHHSLTTSGEWVMRTLGILALVVFLSSCAAPRFYNGKYYMAGDLDCQSMSQLDESRVMCYDSSKKETGYRQAMTDQQLQMYMHEQAMSQAYSSTIANSAKQTRPLTCSSNVIGRQVFTNCW